MPVGQAVDIVERRAGGAQCPADADRERAELAIGGKGCGGDRAADALGHDVGRRGIGAHQQDAEFLAAETTDQVVPAHRIADGPGDPAQGLVAVIVAEAVVDALEIVGIHDQQRPALVAIAALQVADDRAGEGAAIEAGGEPVSGGQIFELAVGVAQPLMLEHEHEQHGRAQRQRNDNRDQHARHVEPGREGLHEQVGENHRQDDGNGADCARDAINPLPSSGWQFPAKLRHG